MNSSLLSVYSISAITVIAFTYAMYKLLAYLQNKNLKLNKIKAMLSGIKEESPESSYNIEEKFKFYLRKFTTYLINNYIPKNNIEELENDLYLAGKRSRDALLEFYDERFTYALFTAVSMFVFSQNLLHVLLAAFIGFMLPKLQLDSIRKDRQRKISQVFPISLDMLVISLEAGYNVINALQNVIDNLEAISHKSGTLRDEYKILLNELKLGLDTETAWNNLYKRTQVSDIKEFVQTILQAEKIGASLASALQNLSLFITNKKTQELETVAASLGAKMTLPLAVCVLPVVIGFVAGPFIYEILDSGAF